MSERGCGYVISEIVADLARKRDLKKLAKEGLSSGDHSS